MSYRLIDPDAKLDFSEDFTDWLDVGVAVTSFIWTIFPLGPTLSDQQDATPRSTIFVSGCTLGVVYRLSCKITTDAGVPQSPERTVMLRCEER